MPIIGEHNIKQGATGAGAGGHIIEGSGSFNGTNGKLTRTIGSAGNRRTFILEVIFKRGGSSSSFLTAYSSGTDTFYTYLSSDQVYIQNYVGSTQMELKSDAKLRDFSAWYHLIYAIDTTQSTDTNRVKAWLNGVELTWASSPRTYPAQDLELKWNTGSQEHQIGHSSTTYSDDYFARAAAYDGLTMTDPVTDGFGEYDDNGVWVVKNVSGKSFGTTGFLIEGGAAFTNGTDSSGNSQNFTKGGTITNVNDTLTDKASDNFGNYATLNPHFANSGQQFTLTLGNTSVDFGNATNHIICATMGFDIEDSTGFKWETTWDAGPSGGYIGLMKIGEANFQDSTPVGGDGVITLLGSTGGIRVGGSTTTYTSVSAGQVVTWRCKSGNVFYDVNGTAANSGSAVLTGKTGFWVPFFTRNSSGTATGYTVNFGAKSFAYSNTEKGISTANLPAPTVVNPENFYNNVFYNGTGSTQSISGVGFQPDFVWIKRRNVTGTNHMLFDSVRGATKFIGSDRTTVETTVADTLTSFDSDGFTLGADASGYGVNVSTSSSTYLAWNWKAGDSNTSVSESGSGSGAINACTHRANTTSGLSIIKYTGLNDEISNSQHTLVTHGLGSAPVFMMGKSLDSAQDWFCMPGENDDTGSGRWSLDNHMHLNTTDDSNGSLHVQPAFPTSTHIKLGNDDLVNKANDEFIMYAWIKVAGLVGYGTYVGNGEATGPVIIIDDGATGFKPAWLMIKRITAAESWFIFNNKSDVDNPAEQYTMADANNTENDGSGGNDVDFLANGFRLRSSNTGTNGSGSYLYLAMADDPFGGDGVTQARAR